MLRKTLSKITVVICCLIMTQQTFGTFIPDEDIKNRQIFSERDANMTQQEFDAVIKKANNFYAPVIASHGAKLTINGRWTDDTLNANASQSMGTWNVNMYGGLARHPEMTLDGFAMVLCHELGHHLAGFSFRKSFFGGTWAANEGQSDYFAAHSCSRELWRNETDINATFRANVNPLVQVSCDKAWTTTEEQDLCYRVNAGGESLSRVLSSLKADATMPTFETPDNNKVSATNHNHPQAQCRMDTTYAASLCKQEFAIDLIPGKEKSDPSGKDAEKESALYTCMEYSNFTDGIRPRCWFKPGI